MQNYGFNIWYDYQQTLLGDDLHFDSPRPEVQNSAYTILCFSENFLYSRVANLELDEVKVKYEKDPLSMHIFPLFFYYDPERLPERYEWLKKLKYKIITDQNTLTHALIQIRCKLLKDELDTSEAPLFYDFDYEKIPLLSTRIFLQKAAAAYSQLDRGNLSARITMIYTMYLFIKTHADKCLPQHLERVIEKTHDLTNLCIQQDSREVKMMELAFSLLLPFLAV